jgi:hypothetical protein
MPKSRPIQFALALVALFLIWLLILQFELLPRLSPAQQQALALMRDRPALGQRNALATLYLLNYDVAASEIPRTFANLQMELAASLRQRDIDLDAGQELIDDPFSILDKGLDRRFKALFSTQSPPTLCMKADACLMKVKRDPEAIRAALMPYAKLPEKVALLHNFDSLDFAPLPADPRLPLPFLQYGTPTLTRFALQAAEGDTAGAVAQTCDFIAMSRRLRNSYSLIANMIGIYNIQVGARLIAEIQAANPTQELPPKCTAALALLAPQEQSLCNAMRGEFAMSSTLFDQLNTAANEVNGKRPRPFARWLTKISINGEHAKAMTALELSAYCKTPYVQPETPVKCGAIEIMANPVGCWLADISRPAFEKYPLRVQDANTHLQLFALAQFARSPRAQACPEDLRCAPQQILPAHFKHLPKQRELQVELLVNQSSQGNPPNQLLRMYY